MNLEETQKINRLAKELLAHHIVGDSNEATARAEKMILGKGEAQEARQEAASQDNDSEIRYIHTNLAQLHADIRRMASEISGLKNGYESLKNSVASIRERNVVPQNVSVAAPAPSAPVAAQQTQPRAQEESPSRMGGFSDEQVAIDKIFYFGKK